jgi:uncharacterized protein
MARIMAGATLAALLCSVPLFAQEPDLKVPAIVTSGEAVIRRPADQSFVTVSVESRARAPKDAQRLNADAMNAVQQKLSDAGIAKDAVRTTGYAIQQEFDYSNGRRVPREYLARNGVEIRVDAIDRTGEILDLVVQAGATAVVGIRFDLKDRVAVERDALRHAVEDARARADAMAAGAGRTVDKVIRIEDARPQRVGIQPQPRMMTASAGAADSAPTPIEGGTIEVRAQILLTVAIR